jgi:hypothetical protein
MPQMLPAQFNHVFQSIHMNLTIKKNEPPSMLLQTIMSKEMVKKNLLPHLTSSEDIQKTISFDEQHLPSCACFEELPP